MESNPPPRRRRLLFYAGFLVFSVVVAAVALEILLRVVPINGIFFRSFYYDPITGGKYYPNSTLIYPLDGKEFRRETNAWGFPDVEHALVAEPGTLRIGFFGDSYTAALQVPIAATFFRLVESDLNAHVDRLGGITNRRGEPVAARSSPISSAGTGWRPVTSTTSSMCSSRTIRATTFID